MPEDIARQLPREQLEAIAKSDYFYQRYRSDIGRRVLHEVQGHAPITVEYKCSPEQFEAILRHIRSVWTALGTSRPHWSVVSTPDFTPDKIEQTIDRFNQSGLSEFQNLKRLLSRLQIKIPTGGLALEYGCGVGRVTRWLASLFETVVAVDISESHLALAGCYFRDEKIDNIALKRIASHEDIAILPAFDFLYSKIVLQHNPPPIIYMILDILLDKLNPGGTGIVQVPTYAKDYVFRVEEYLTAMSGMEKMEMHVLPQPVIFDLLDSHRCLPREVFRDHLAATVDFVSTTFIFQKAAGRLAGEQQGG